MSSQFPQLAGRRPLRRHALTAWLLTVALVSGCDLWPRNFAQLGESISQQVSGEATAWLVGGDILVIEVTNSPLYQNDRSDLEALATGIAEEGIAYSATPLESILITFYQGQVSDDPEKMREFIFLVMEEGPVLQPEFAFDATGPLTLAEIQTLFNEPMTESFTPEHMECVLGEVDKLARSAGDPETLDPASVDFLPAESWNGLDAYGKRLILAQAITTKALFDCAGQASG